MKSRKGFTLVELLAVVVILGLLLLIAIPAVSDYIEQSRRDTYIDGARQYVLAAADQIANGDLAIHDRDTTYYIDIRNIKVEKAGVDSPYGKWENAYVVVTIDDSNAYNYYWISIDSSGHRIDLTKSEELNRNSIYESDNFSIPTDVLLDDTCIIVVYDENNKRTTSNHCDELSEDKEYTIILKQNGGSGGTERVSVKFGQPLPDIKVPTREGHKFLGYYFDISGDEKQYYSNSGKGLINFDKKGNVTLYAKWEANLYTISYDANGGDHNPDKQTKKHGIDINLTYDVPSRDSYVFAGWDTERNGSGTRYLTGAIYSANANVTLYAQWEANKYFIYFDGNGNTGGTMSSMACAYDEGCILPDNEFFKTGYHFGGWTFNGVEYDNRAIVKNLTSEQNGSVTLTAKWTANSYTISFNGNGNTGGEMPSMRCNYDQDCALTLNAFTNTGNTFTGWINGVNVYTDGQKVRNLTELDNGNITLIAMWSISKYKLIYNSNGGSKCDSLVREYGTTWGTLCAPTRTGYVFNGWYSGNTQITSESIVYNDVNVTASWLPITYYISFDPNGGTGTTEAMICKYDQDCTLTANGFEKAGRSWVGWSYGGNTYINKQKIRNLTTINGAAIVMKALWSDNTYTLTYNSNGGSTCYSKSKTYGQTWGDLCVPTRTGYTFNGWYNGTTEITSSSTVTGDIVLTASWTPNIYYIRFNSGSDVTVPQIICEYDKNCYLNGPSFTIDGLSFAGWSYGGTIYPANSNVINLTTVNGGIVTMTAIWVQNSYTLTYVLDSDSYGCTSQTATAGNAWGPLCNPVSNTPRYFEGWYTLSGSPITSANVATSDLTVYAHWRTAYKHCYQFSCGSYNYSDAPSTCSSEAIFTCSCPDDQMSCTLSSGADAYTHWTINCSCVWE